MAPLRRNLDGSVYLDDETVSDEPQFLRVRLEVEGRVVGQSTPSFSLDDEAPIRDQLLQARDAIFDEELWQELNREARTLGPYGVRMSATTITCPIDPFGTMILEMVTTEHGKMTEPQTSNGMADALGTALRLLLSQAHRQLQRRRASPPAPLVSTKKTSQPHYLLRSVLCRLSYEKHVAAFYNLLIPLTAALQKASLPGDPRFELNRTDTAVDSESTGTIAGTIIARFIDRLESVTKLHLPGATIQIISRTSIHGLITTLHIPSIQPINSALQKLCPPPTLFQDFESVKGYILYATSCSIASAFADTSPGDDQEVDTSESGLRGWFRTHQPNILRKSYRHHGRSKQVCFELIEHAKSSVQLRLRWDWMGRSDAGKDPNKSAVQGEGSYVWSSSQNLSDPSAAEAVQSIGQVLSDAGQWHQV